MGQFLARVWDILSRRVDSFLFGVALTIAGVGLITLFSAADQSLARVWSQVTSLGFALLLMWIVANVPPQTIARVAVPLYAVGIVLLIAVALFGVTVNGSRAKDGSNLVNASTVVLGNGKRVFAGSSAEDPATK